MSPRPIRAAAGSALVLALLSAGAPGPRPATAQTVLVEGDAADLLLTGYVRALTAGHDRGYELTGASRRTGLHSEVVRVQWQLRGSPWTVELHNRLQVRVGDPVAAGVGLGVSATPGRGIDLSTMLVDEPSLRAWHDVDRLSVSTRAGPVDLTVGRQAVTWGTSTLFPVADLWTSFSPFELDRTEKPGIDAVRAFLYPADRLEVDLIVADRGRLEDLSAGVRATYGLPSADVWFGAGKLWRHIMAMGGLTLLGQNTRARAEVVLPYALPGAAPADPRATLGLDWIRGRLSVTGEYHYNGIGASEAGDYIAVLMDPRLARGETYHLGRHYAGGAAAWTPDADARLELGLSALVNLNDPSAAVTPLLSYDIAQAASLSLGALVSLGRAPSDTVPVPRSEFGLYGDLLFTRLSLFF